MSHSDVTSDVTHDGNNEQAFTLSSVNFSYYFLEIFARNILGQCVSVSVEVARSENNGLKFAK